METISETEFASHAAEYLAKVQHGQGLLIIRGAQTVAVILPVFSAPEPRVFGLYKGRLRVHADFNQPLPDDVFGELLE